MQMKSQRENYQHKKKMVVGVLTLNPGFPGTNFIYMY